MTLPYRGNRRQCHRKYDRNARNYSPQIIIRDEEQPYACTSRCGAKFKSKGEWKRHEETNYPQELWYCCIGTCKSKPAKKRVSFRKDHYKNHLIKQHGYIQVTNQDLRESRFPINSLFSRQCIFQNCDECFEDWKERTNHIAKEFEEPWDIAQWRDINEETNDADSGMDGHDKLDTSGDDSSDSDNGHDDHGASAEPDSGAGSGSGSGSGSGQGHHYSGQFDPSSTIGSYNLDEGGTGGSYRNGFHSQWQATHYLQTQSSTTAKVQPAISLPLRTWLPLKMDLLTTMEGVQGQSTFDEVLQVYG